MMRLTYYRVKNAMLLSTLVSNLIGVSIVRFIPQRATYLFTPEIEQLADQIDTFFLPVSFLLPLVLILIYERPIRVFFKSRFERRPLPATTELMARRRLLNEPFFLIGLSFCMWIAAALIYSGVFWFHHAGVPGIRAAFFRSLYTGLITVTVAFFVLEFVLQRRVIPQVFPEGGLSEIPGTLRIRIRTRLAAFFLACNIVPLVSFMQTAQARLNADGPYVEALKQIQSVLVFEGLTFMAVGIWLTFLVSSNLTRPLKEITQVLQRVQSGQFETKVKVTSNDEIGYAGDVINAMTDGLIERDRMKQSLALAQEIQQNLFPKHGLTFASLDVAGKSLYCEETGGDYFDFIPMADDRGQKLGVVIGDVSGHGISSALLMATVRSALRQRTFHVGGAAQIISDVNRQLVQDVEQAGEFVTLFFLVVDPVRMEILWVRAGHDPAILYDPARDSFEELGGSGMALGVDGGYRYHAQRRVFPAKGQIILLGTDGLWEATGPQGARFGKKAVAEALRAHHRRSAGEIVQALLDAQAAFQRGHKKEDDVTLVALKASA